MALRRVLVSAAAALGAVRALASPVESRAEDAALSFIREFVANLTEAADEAQSCSQESSMTVDLGYAKYRGYHDEETDLNIWKGLVGPDSRRLIPPQGVPQRHVAC